MNAGSRPGTEIVQLYIRQRGTSVARPVRELKGFEKITLEPGKSRLVKFMLTKKELAFWNIDMHHIVEPGELTIWIAPNCQEGKEAKVMIGP
jgi:beta-glucosidase